MPMVTSVEESLVDSFDATYTEWLTFGPSPYLNLVTNYIYTSLNAKYEGDFGFPASAGSGQINSVKLGFDCKCLNALGYGFDVYVWNGASWVYAGFTTITSTIYAWLPEIDVSSILDTWDKINGAKVRLVSDILEPETIYCRRCKRIVDYGVPVAIASKRLLVGLGI